MRVTAADASDTPAHHRPDGGFRNPWPGGERAGVGGLLRWMLVERRGGPVVDRARIAAAYPRATPARSPPGHGLRNPRGVWWEGMP